MSNPSEPIREPPGEPLRGDRRRHQRFPLHLAVNLHVAWRSEPFTVEMIDIGAKGVRFRSRSEALRLDQEAAFGFVVGGLHVCVANGRVVRVGQNGHPAAGIGHPAAGNDGEFVVSIERANAAFHDFLGSLAA